MVEQRDPRQTLTRPSLLARCLTGFAQALKWLFLSLLFSILMEWIGMLFWWEAQGVTHSQRMLTTELQFLAEDFRRSLISADPVHFAQGLMEKVYWLLFELTRLADLSDWVSRPLHSEEAGLRALLHRGYQPLAEFVQAAMQITQVFAVRLAILCLATPVFGLFGLVALVDGLVRRDLRRWGGGRESSFVYHYAKKAAMPLIVATWVIYLALPFSLHPSWVILPFASVFGLTITITAGTFKKYL